MAWEVTMKNQPTSGSLLGIHGGLSTVPVPRSKGAHIQHQGMRLIRWCTRSKGAGSKQGLSAWLWQFQ